MSTYKSLLRIMELQLPNAECDLRVLGVDWETAFDVEGTLEDHLKHCGTVAHILTKERYDWRVRSAASALELHIDCFDAPGDHIKKLLDYDEPMEDIMPSVIESVREIVLATLDLLSLYKDFRVAQPTVAAQPKLAE